MNSQWRAVRFNGEFRNYQQRILDYADQYFADGHVHIVAPPGQRQNHSWPRTDS